MPAEPQPTTSTRIVRREGRTAPRELCVDICVVGAGIAGTSAALQAARLGRRVAIVDGLPALGGQAVNSIISTFCGLFSNGTHGYQFTYGIADEILGDLEKQDKALYYRNGPITTVVYYDEIALGRWVERAIEKAGSRPIGRRGAARGDGRRPANFETALRYPLRRRDHQRHRLHRCHWRCSARLERGPPLPRAVRRQGLRHADAGAGEHRRGARPAEA